MPSLLMASTVPNFLRAFLLPYARWFRNAGWTVDAMANGVSANAECVAAFDRVWDVTWARNPLQPSNLIRAPQRVAEIVARGGYDIVHVHTPVAGMACRMALRKSRRAGPVRIYTAHGFHFHEHGSSIRNAAFLALEKLAGRWTDYLVVINRDDEAAALRHRLVSPDRLLRMPGIGIDLDGAYRPLLSVETSDLHRELGLPIGSSLFAMVAEFIPRKRHADGLRAIAALNRSDVHLALAGEGPETGKVKQLAADLGLADRVHFLGHRSDVRRIVGSSRALLLCSDQEGLPRSVMESLSVGTPVIGSDIRGTRELLEDGAGYLYQLGDIRQLSQAMNLVLQNPSDAVARTTRGRSRLDRYCLQHVIRLHEDLYARALGAADAKDAVLASRR